MKSNSTFLEDDELYDLTHRKRCDAQLKQLRQMGIQCRVRADGSLAVLREHINREMGGVDSKEKKPTPIEPDWSALSA